MFIQLFHRIFLERSITCSYVTYMVFFSSYLQLLNKNVNERPLWIFHELSTCFSVATFSLIQGVLVVGQFLERGQLLLSYLVTGCVIASCGIVAKLIFPLFFCAPSLSHCLLEHGTWDTEPGPACHLEKCYYWALGHGQCGKS